MCLGDFFVEAVVAVESAIKYSLDGGSGEAVCTKQN